MESKKKKIFEALKCLAQSESIVVNLHGEVKPTLKKKANLGPSFEMNSPTAFTRGHACEHTWSEVAFGQLRAASQRS